jgi:Holliday junction resolvase-like predicted endonuclease
MDDVIVFCRKHYEKYYAHLRENGCSDIAAAKESAHRYLDGKPFIKGLTHIKRSTAFWSCHFWQKASEACFEVDVVALAMGSTMQHDDPKINALKRILLVAPETVKRGIRYSLVYLRPKSKLWQTVLQLSSTASDDFKLFLKICVRLCEELQMREAAVKELQRQIADLSVLDTLIYGSLYAYQTLIPDRLAAFPTDIQTMDQEQEAWDALNQLLSWKLRTRPSSDFQLTDGKLGESLKQHMVPLLFQPNKLTKTCKQNLDLFSALVGATIECNNFRSTAITSFSFDDDYRYKLNGDLLTIYPIEVPEKSEWDRNGQKLTILNHYWFNRAFIETTLAGVHDQPFGSPGNDTWNRLAYIKAYRVFMQLSEIYGLGVELDVPNGTHVDLFKALHSLELMTVFFNVSFIHPFEAFYKESGNWGLALQQLAINGLRKDMQNRFPLTWAKLEDKAQSIKAWTVSKENPTGNLGEAKAILALWTSDLKALADSLRIHPNNPVPEFHEKPILKLGNFDFQLPWLTAAQNNATAAINNLRRIGSRRKARSDETHRIEYRLGKQLEKRGFSVVKGYLPEKTDIEDPGEIDLICFFEGYLFIFEVKSTYIRKTKQEAWIHRTNTLRKAAQQLKRKQKAIISALGKDETLFKKLNIHDYTEINEVNAWIVDTSIEYDQEFIDGFLKISLEAILIVLRNEKYLLRSSLLNKITEADEYGSADFSDLYDLYGTGKSLNDDLFPQGFTAKRFSEIIKGGELWNNLDEI